MVVSQEATMPPTLPWTWVHHTRPCWPVNKQQLSSNQRGTDSWWTLGVASAHQHHWAPPRLALWFLSQGHTRGQEQRQEQNSTILTNGFLRLCAVGTSSFAKDSGCCGPEWKATSVSFDAWASFHPYGSTGQEKHAHSGRMDTPKGSTPSHFTQPELPGLLGTYLGLNIHIYVYTYVWIYIHKYLYIALAKEKVNASRRCQRGTEAHSSALHVLPPPVPDSHCSSSCGQPLQNLGSGNPKTKELFSFQKEFAVSKLDK